MYRLRIEGDSRERAMNPDVFLSIKIAHSPFHIFFTYIVTYLYFVLCFVSGYFSLFPLFTYDGADDGTEDVTRNIVTNVATSGCDLGAGVSTEYLDYSVSRWCLGGVGWGGS